MRASVSTPGILLVAALVVGACSADTPPPATPAPTVRAPAAPPTPASPPPAATPDPAAGPGARAAYIESICPPFEALALLDPRLAALRSARADEVDVTTLAPEIEAVAAELRVILNELAAVPEWIPGAVLRNEVTLALHDLRIALLDAGGSLSAPDAPDRLAGLPFIARPSIDLGMQRATDAGFECSFD